MLIQLLSECERKTFYSQPWLVVQIEGLDDYERTNEFSVQPTWNGYNDTCLVPNSATCAV